MAFPQHNSLNSIHLFIYPSVGFDFIEVLIKIQRLLIFSICFVVFTFIFFKNCIATFSDLEPEEPPRFGKKLNQETVVLEGDPFSLQLQVFGNPKPNVTWYFEDQPLEENEFMRITSKGGWHKVEFDEVLVDDEGFYRCVAENELGVVETETSLLVDGKLFLSIPPH